MRLNIVFRGPFSVRFRTPSLSRFTALICIPDDGNLTKDRQSRSAFISFLGVNLSLLCCFRVFGDEDVVTFHLLLGMTEM